MRVASKGPQEILNHLVDIAQRQNLTYLFYYSWRIMGHFVQHGRELLSSHENWSAPFYNLGKMGNYKRWDIRDKVSFGFGTFLLLLRNPESPVA